MSVHLNIQSLSSGGKVAVSEAQLINALTMKEHDKATQIGLLDRFLDLFRKTTKKEVLEQLYEISNSHNERANLQTTIAYRLFAIRSLLDTSDQCRMAVSAKEEPGGNIQVNYNIALDDKMITLLDETVDRATFQKVSACWGGVYTCVELPDSKVHARDLDDIKINTLSTPEPVLPLLDQAVFSATTGGCNKQYVACPQFGLLQIPSAKSEQELRPESYIADISQRVSEIQRYVSPQKQLAQQRIPGLKSPDYVYAIVDAYNPHVIKPGTLMEAVQDTEKPLSFGQLKSICMQLIDAMRIFYKYRLSHGDLHMGNIQILRQSPLPATSSENAGENEDKVYLRLFDFGRLKCNEQFDDCRTRDIDYLFCRKGDSPLETLARNHLMPERSAGYQKHYPLHTLMNMFNTNNINVTMYLQNIGEKLSQDLSSVEVSSSVVDQAFESALNKTLQLAEFVYH